MDHIMTRIYEINAGLQHDRVYCTSRYVKKNVSEFLDSLYIKII